MKDWKCTANQDKIITYLKAYNERCVDDMKKIDDIAWALTETIDYDWYNNAGGQGYIIWYIEEGKIVTEGQQNTQHYLPVLSHVADSYGVWRRLFVRKTFGIQVRPYGSEKRATGEN